MSNTKILSKKEINNIGILPFQRQASLRSSLVDSMKKYGFLGSILMIKTSVLNGIEKLYIIDGQHRFLAAQFLNLPIAASIIETNKSKQELIYLISTLNSTGIKWTTIDYINAYASLNNSNYINIINLSKSCKKLSLNKILDAWKNNIGTIRKGDLVVSEEVISNIKKLDEVLHKIPRQRSKDLNGIFSTIKEKKFDIEIFRKKYLENIELLTPLLPTEKERIYKSWF